MRELSGLLWLILAVWTMPSVWHVLRGRPTLYDPIWAAFFFLSIVCIGFSWAWIAMPHAMFAMSSSELQIRFGLQVLMLLVVCSFLGVRRVYGRG